MTYTYNDNFVRKCRGFLLKEISILTLKLNMKKTGAHKMKRKDKNHEKLLLNVRKTDKDSNFMASKRITVKNQNYFF